jgi:hypothetical protein
LKTNWPAEHILFMAKKMPKSVTKARSRQKPNLVTFFAFFLKHLAMKDVKIKPKNLSFCAFVGDAYRPDSTASADIS